MAIFLGTPAAALPSLAALVDVADVDLVITQPDRPRRRSAKPIPPPVKVAAQEWGLRIAQPNGPDELLAAVRSADPEVAVVVGYGRILSSAVIASSALGFLNVHFSLLPRWRGAAPVERAILEGDASTGVSLMVIDEGLDTGPVLAAIETPIEDDETGGSLTSRLAFLGAKLIDNMVPDFLNGRLQPAPQLGGGVRMAPMLTKAEAQIDGTWSVEQAERAVRAFHPRPGAWIDIDGEPVRVLGAEFVDASVASGDLEPLAGNPILGLADGSLRLVEVQPAGKTPVDGRSWMNGRRAEPGTVSEAP